MTLAPSTVGIAMVIASLLILGLLLHYLSRVGRRHDILCVMGMLAASTGLLGLSSTLHFARNPLEPSDILTLSCFGLCSLSVGFAIWREGFRRFRNAG